MRALIEAVDAHLMGDAALGELFPGSVEVYYKMAKRDAPMPYIVHLSDLRGDEQCPLLRGRHLFDVWDYGDTADRALAIAARIRELFAGKNLPVLGTLASFKHSVTRDVGTDAEDVHRIALEFAVLCYDVETANAVLER